MIPLLLALLLSPSEWIAQLASDDFSVREAAQRSLEASDAPAEEELARLASLASDLEVRDRLDRVLEIRRCREAGALMGCPAEEIRRIEGKGPEGTEVHLYHKALYGAADPVDVRVRIRNLGESPVAVAWTRCLAVDKGNLLEAPGEARLGPGESAFLPLPVYARWARHFTTDHVEVPAILACGEGPARPVLELPALGLDFEGLSGEAEKRKGQVARMLEAIRRDHAGQGVGRDSAERMAHTGKAAFSCAEVLGLLDLDPSLPLWDAVEPHRERPETVRFILEGIRRGDPRAVSFVIQTDSGSEPRETEGALGLDGGLFAKGLPGSAKARPFLGDRKAFLDALAEGLAVQLDPDRRMQIPFESFYLEWPETAFANAYLACGEKDARIEKAFLAWFSGFGGREDELGSRRAFAVAGLLRDPAYLPALSGLLDDARELDGWQHTQTGPEGGWSLSLPDQRACDLAALIYCAIAGLPQDDFVRVKREVGRTSIGLPPLDLRDAGIRKLKARR